MARLFGRAIPLWTRMFPKQSEPRGLPVVFPMATATTFEISLNLTEVGLDFVNGVFIDNSKNGAGFTLYNSVTGQNILCPAYSQANLALITAKSTDAIAFVGMSQGGVDVPVIFRNTEPTSDGIYAVIPPGEITGAVTVQGQITAIPQSLAYTTQMVQTGGGVILPANPARKALLLRNPATALSQGIAAPEPLYVSWDGNPAVVNQSWELLPGEQLPKFDPVPVGSIYIASMTANHNAILSFA